MIPPQLEREAREQMAENEAIKRMQDEDGYTPLVRAAMKAADENTQRLLVRLSEWKDD